MSMSPPQVIDGTTEVDAASNNDQANHIATIYNQHVVGTIDPHPSNAFAVPALPGTAPLASSATDGTTAFDRFANAIRVMTNGATSGSWAGPVAGLLPGQSIVSLHTLLLAHAHSDATNGGKLSQANTHQSPDTD